MTQFRQSVARSRQRGLSFIGLVVVLLIAVCVIALGTKSLPMLMEWQAVNKAVRKAAGEGNTVAEVRASFDRAAAIDDIRSISGSDLQVTKQNDQVVVSYEYSQEIPLFGPAYLLYRFKGSSK